jgi:type II restriction/modification system DNA methylase subunit YeeA
MSFSYRLERLSQIVDDVQVDLKKLIKELSRISDEELEALIIDWIEALKKADAYLEEAEDIMWNVAQAMKKEGL